jgi:uncharacterized membrane protein (GlpM family)
MVLKYLFYFLIGGTVVSVVTYYASHSRTLFAAFIANLPVMTLITFLMIYREAGEAAVVPYAKGLLIMLMPWLLYIFTVVFMTPRIGVVSSLLAGLTSYVAIAYLILKRF